MLYLDADLERYIKLQVMLFAGYYLQMGLEFPIEMVVNLPPEKEGGKEKRLNMLLMKCEHGAFYYESCESVERAGAPTKLRIAVGIIL